jgi:hypothetical protein
LLVVNNLMQSGLRQDADSNAQHTALRDVNNELERMCKEVPEFELLPGIFGGWKGKVVPVIN